MAAVLCGGIGKVCSGCCECMSATCLAPFKLCGACCEGCGQCCQDGCKLVTNCCSSSLCCYITVVSVLNVPPILLGLSDLPNLGAGCQASYWLIIYWLLCLVHILAAFYMSRAIDQDTTILPTAQQQGMSNFDASGGASRVKQLFCYDGWMAVYILILCGYFVWLFLGGALFALDAGEECDDTMGTVSIAYSFGWAFVFVGGCSLCCSLCCGAFSGPRPNNSTPHFVNTNQQAAAPPAAAAAPAASATSKPTSSFAASAPTPVTPVSPSAPPEVEVPIASAEPIYDNTTPAKAY